MPANFEPTPAAAQARLAAVRPAAYARSRNALDGAVTGLSPYISHGFLSLRQVLTALHAREPLEVQHKLVYELGWRAYFRHVWQHRGTGILQSLHPGLLPDAAYARSLPDDVLQGQTGLPVIDQAVRQLYQTGWLHNHARMWLASYLVHGRKLHWRTGADWLYAHLLDGDLASNHLSWQWVAGTGSSKPYLFNADNVARYAPPDWHNPGTVIDTAYETLDLHARQPRPWPVSSHRPAPPLAVPALHSAPLDDGWGQPDAAQVAGRDVWLVHPWSLGALPDTLPPDTLVLGVALADFHCQWPWSAARWHFVAQGMAALTPLRWYADAAQLNPVLQQARRVRMLHEPHAALIPLPAVTWEHAPALFPVLAQRFDSFSSWWRQATRGLKDSADLLDQAL
jgi:deoxyribodipyrimidine photo-lyase